MGDVNNNPELRGSLGAKIDLPVFRLVGDVADKLGRECYVVGGMCATLCLAGPRRMLIS